MYLAIVAFCFSMTVGVLWEFFEFSGDYLLGLDMQKDTVVNAIHSVNMDPTLTNTVIHVNDIVDTIVVHSDGSQQALGLGGYLDIGIYDIHSVNMDPTLTNTVIHVNDIVDTIVVHSDGSQQALGLGGYLDIGIYDTMKDLFVNLVGAVVFSIIGFFYVKQKGKGRVALCQAEGQGTGGLRLYPPGDCP